MSQWNSDPKSAADRIVAHLLSVLYSNGGSPGKVAWLMGLSEGALQPEESETELNPLVQDMLNRWIENTPPENKESFEVLSKAVQRAMALVKLRVNPPQDE